MKFSIFLLFLFSSTLAFAKGGFSRELTVSLGMVNNSILENESGITVTDATVIVPDEVVTVPAPVSNISIGLNWSFNLKKQSSFGIMVTAPVVVTDATSFFLAGLRYRRFFYSVASAYEFMQKGVNFLIQPKLRYFAGGSITSGYLIYNKLSEKKNDLSLNLGVEGGIMYQLYDDYALEFSAAMIKRTGILTSGMGMNIFLGVGIKL